MTENGKINEKVFTAVGFSGSIVLLISSIDASTLFEKIVFLAMGWFVLFAVSYKVLKNIKISTYVFSYVHF